MIRLRMGVAILLLSCLALPSRADLPPNPGRGPVPPPPLPKPPEAKQPVQFMIRVGVKGSQPVLTIPRQVQANLRAEGPGVDEPPALAEAPRGQTMALGLSMTCAAALGGFWLVRRTQLSRRTLTMVLTGIVLAGSTWTLWANAPAPPLLRKLQQQDKQAVMLPDGVLLPNLQVRIADKGEIIELVLPPEMLPTAAQAQPPAQPEPLPPPRP